MMLATYRVFPAEVLKRKLEYVGGNSWTRAQKGCLRQGRNNDSRFNPSRRIHSCVRNKSSILEYPRTAVVHVYVGPESHSRTKCA